MKDRYDIITVKGIQDKYKVKFYASAFNIVALCSTNPSKLCIFIHQLLSYFYHKWEKEKLVQVVYYNEQPCYF